MIHSFHSFCFARWLHCSACGPREESFRFLDSGELLASHEIGTATSNFLVNEPRNAASQIRMAVPRTVDHVSIPPEPTSLSRLAAGQSSE